MAVKLSIFGSHRMPSCRRMSACPSSDWDIHQSINPLCMGVILLAYWSRGVPQGKLILWYLVQLWAFSAYLTLHMWSSDSPALDGSNSSWTCGKNGEPNLDIWHHIGIIWPTYGGHMVKIWWNSAKSGSSTSRAVLFRCGALWLLQAEWLGCSITLHSVSGSPLRCFLRHWSGRTIIEKCLKHYQTAQQLYIWTGYRDKELLQHPLQRSELNSALKVIWIHQGIEVSYVHFASSLDSFYLLDLVSSFVVS